MKPILLPTLALLSSTLVSCVQPQPAPQPLPVQRQSWQQPQPRPMQGGYCPPNQGVYYR